MTWTAPEAERTNSLLIADERMMLESWLEFHRTTLLQKCSGLTADRLCERAVPPSPLSLLGLLRHMTEVERSWFRRRIAGEATGHLYAGPERPDGDINDVVAGNAEADFAAYSHELELVRAAAAEHDLDAVFLHTGRQIQMSVRWVYVHMIGEYARHNGHADLLRERIDGSTGF